MKSKLALLPLVLLGVPAYAQNVGGCISHFAENYDPNATFNDGSCNYDLQQLLNDGFELGDLLSSGVEVDELIGLFGAGGFIVDIDLDNGRNLVAWPFRYERMVDNNEDLTYYLQSDMFRDRDFGSGIYDGHDNWEKIRKAYAYRYPGAYTSALADYYGAWNTDGCSDWFVPTESALLLYKSVCQTKHGTNTYNIVKDINPDSGIENVVIHLEKNMRVAVMAAGFAKGGRGWRRGNGGPSQSGGRSAGILQG